MTIELAAFASGALAVPAAACAFEALRLAGWLAWAGRAVSASFSFGHGAGPRRGDLLPAATVAAASVVVGSPTFGAASAAVPFVLVAAREALRRRRAREVERTLPAALRATADSISAGASLEHAAATAGSSAAGSALARFSAARVGGADLDSALGVLAGSDREAVWAEVTAAIALRRRCGGDLGAALRSLARELDAIATAKREARAATAQARFTANLVCAMPIVAAVGSELLRPGSVAAVLGNALALSLAACALVVQFGCLIVIRRIAGAVAE